MCAGMTRLFSFLGCLSDILLELLYGDELLARGRIQMAVGLLPWWLRPGRLHDCGHCFTGEKSCCTDLTLDDFGSGIGIGIKRSWQLMGYTFTLQHCDTLSWTQFASLLGQTWAILGARQSYLPDMGSCRFFLVRTGDSCLVRIVFGLIIGLVIVGCLQTLALDNCPKEHCLVAELYFGFRGASNGTHFGEGTSS